MTVSPTAIATFRVPQECQEVCHFVHADQAVAVRVDHLRESEVIRAT